MMQERIYSSRELHRAYMTRPSWQHPSRREHVHGRILPANDNRDRSAPYFIALALIVAAYFLVRFI